MNPLTLTDLALQVTRKTFAQFRFPVPPTLLQILQEENPFISTKVYFKAKFISVCPPFRLYAQTSALSVQMDYFATHYIIKHQETGIQIITPRDEDMDEHDDTFVEILCPLPALHKIGIFGVSEIFRNFGISFTPYPSTRFNFSGILNLCEAKGPFSFELLLTPESIDSFCQSAHNYGIQWSNEATQDLCNPTEYFETFANEPSDY